jgi:hypothetical protein
VHTLDTSRHLLLLLLLPLWRLPAVRGCPLTSSCCCCCWPLLLAATLTLFI